VSGLTFLAIGVDDNGTVALVDVYVNNAFSTTVNVTGNASPQSPDLVDLTAFSNVTSIEIHTLTDSFGIGWDDFTFTVNAAPEPGSLALMALGLAAFGLGRRRFAR
jgi:hypothetical protein